VFLLGCARSGTSILGEALAEHPRIAYLFEVSRIWNDLVPPKGDHRLVACDVTSGVAEAIYRALAQKRDELYPAGKPASSTAGTDVLLEKNPKHVIRIPFLRGLFPHGRYVHIIRDGRDTVASLMFRNRGDRWGHLEIPGWRELLERYPRRNHIRCAHQWRDSVHIARQDAASLPVDAYREVRYEALLEQPKEVVDGIFRFLGLEPDPSVDAFLPRIQDSTRGSYHARKQVRHYIDNHSRRVGRFHENLSPEQLREIEDVCGDLLQELGYLP
jgi:hypothetical protein